MDRNGTKPDALVLCGGYGTRLEPISEFVPKALLPVRGKPIINHIIGDTYGLVDRIIVSTNVKFADQFAYWVKNKELEPMREKLSFVIDPSTKEKEKLGVVRGTAYAIEKARLDKGIIIFSSDVFREFSIKAFITQFSETPKPAILLRDLTEYGILAGSHVSWDAFVELNAKLEEVRRRTLTCGVIACPPGIASKISDYSRVGGNPDSLSAFVRWLGKDGNLELVTSTGISYDIGTIEAYRMLVREKRDSDVSEKEVGVSGPQERDVACPADIEGVTHAN